VPSEPAVADAILKNWFGRTAPTVPSDYYIGLSTTYPPNAGYTEPPAGSGYVRAPYANTAANWTTPADQMISNVNIITWPQPATADWPAVGWICLFDAVDTLHHWTTCPSLVVASGVTPFISPGALSILVNL